MSNDDALLQDSRKNRGTAAIEFGIAAPLMIVLVAGLLELGFGIQKKMQVQNAAEAGAFYAIKHGWDSAAIGAAVVTAVPGAAISASPAPTQFCGCPGATGVTHVACTATCTGGGSAGIYVQVYASAPRDTLLPGGGFSFSSTLTAYAVVRLQ